MNSLACWSSNISRPLDESGDFDIALDDDVPGRSDEINVENTDMVDDEDECDDDDDDDDDDEDDESASRLLGRTLAPTSGCNIVLRCACPAHSHPHYSDGCHHQHHHFHHHGYHSHHHPNTCHHKHHQCHHHHHHCD